jgi:hypothetical protein
MAVHGAYDLSLFMPGFPAFFPVAIAVVSFASTLEFVGQNVGGDI